MSGFRFDFQMPSTAESTSVSSSLQQTMKEQEQEIVVEQQPLHITPSPSINNPLVFLQDVPSLLLQRSQQEHLQYDTLALHGCDGTDGSSSNSSQIESEDMDVHVNITRNVLLRARIQSSNNPNKDQDTVQQQQQQQQQNQQSSLAKHNTYHESKIVQDLEKKQTDILPGVYEGGLKVWECSIDLCRYMTNHVDDLLSSVDSYTSSNESSINRKGTFILELGCGQALPGCFLLREGLTKIRRMQQEQEQQQEEAPFSVLFTDYNDFVLHDVTISNIVLNTRQCMGGCLSPKDANDISNHVVIAAGDWMSLSHKLLQPQQILPQPTGSTSPLLPDANKLPSNGRFDIILAAETTYTSKAAQETATLMAKHLAFTTGIGLVATKRYYFGVGGGSDAFRDAAASFQRIVNPATTTSTAEDCYYYGLSVETLEVYDNGAGNIRELLCVKLVPQKS